MVRLHGLRRDRKAISPAISTVIITSAVVILLLVTVSFANNFLNARLAENEFSTIKQFMQTVGLQVDDVAWTMGRTQTIRYASRFGLVNFESAALNYTIYFNNSPIANFTNQTGILLFNMPIDKFSMGNGFHERIFPTSNNSFLQAGTSAPVNHVYVIEKVPMNDGNYMRVVVAPSIRMLNSTISTGSGAKNYFKFYLPILSAGDNPRYSQSVTLTGNKVAVKSEGSINRIRIVAGFPKGNGTSGPGFDNAFFKFEATEEVVDLPSGSIVEFYTSEVIVAIGLHV